MAYVATQPYRRFNRWDPPSPRRVNGAGDYRRCRRGMGATGTQELSAAGATIMAAAPLTGPAAPFVALGGAITEMLASFGVGSGCGQTCVLSSQFADKAEAQLRQNIALYFAQTPPRLASTRTAALQNYDQIWTWLYQQCSNSQLGDAGRACISDRTSGACKWKANADSPYPGGPKQGACWNWFSGYRDPIANDADVVEDSVSSLVSSVLPGVSSASLVPLALITALVIVGVML